MIKRTMAALAYAAALAATGCGTSATDVCDLQCDCKGCSDREYDDCVDEIDDGFRDAEREGCEAEYDEYLACVDDTAECHGDKFETHCGPEKDDFKRCIE